MRRREFFGKLIGVVGVAAFPVMASAETVSGQEFEIEPCISCPSCGFVMPSTQREGKTVYWCCNGSRFQEDETGRILYFVQGCPRAGIEYRAPKIRMERVS